MAKQQFRAPFLRRIATAGNLPRVDEFPFNVPAFRSGIDIALSRPVTILVGENGSGKSTLLEAVAARCGFNVSGGNRNHAFSAGSDNPNALAATLRLSWLPKVSSGFFMRAESFFDFASYIDQLAKDDPGLVSAYGGKSLHAQSHGESFLALVKHRFGQQGVYILDEPEAALSPARQLAFLALIGDLETTGVAQFIIATHSPILLSYPNALLLSMDGDSIHAVGYRDTEHYKVMKDFLDCPERYHRHLMVRDNATDPR